MDNEEAKEILDHNWTKLVNPDYSDEELGEALDVVLNITRNLHNFMRGLWEEHCMGDVTYTSKEIYDMISREIFGDKGE